MPFNNNTSITNEAGNIVNKNNTNAKLADRKLNTVYTNQNELCQQMYNSYNYYIDEPGMNFGNSNFPGYCVTPNESVLTRSKCLNTRRKKARNIPGSYNLRTMNDSYVYGRNMLNDSVGFLL